MFNTAGKTWFEVAVVTRIVHNLYKAWKGLRQQLNVTITSPYSAQLVEIRDKLGQKYRSYDGFTVKMIGIDELQGSEEDIVILSTVRSNSDGSIGRLLSDHEKINVVLTSARQRLWILGDECTLTRSESIWKSIMSDAKDRKCFFNVEEDKDLAQFIIEVKKELDQLDELLDTDSFLFRNARWKVLFSDNFMKSFEKIKSTQMKKLVVNMLMMLANGWRPKRMNVNITCCKSKQILKRFKVKDLHVICSVDIVKEYSYIQVLKIWDVLPLVEIPKLINHLDAVFLTYPADSLNRCKAKCFEGDLEVPMSWETASDIVCYKKRNYVQEGIRLTAEASDNRRSFKKKFNMSDSLQLMKFYPLSSGMMSHLLSGCISTEMELPFELTSQEMEIVQSDKSSFILGRSGTGKTTVLIRKLYFIESSYTT
ncbi:P-loop containing nucleoside triphosphate hydrolase [Trema orientale]|uniref:P-loop containing nucleoside triphosphate hydrolase n=1 Tax=Trema orientale TaxID=63057 RepID=A0A2P5CGD5_TREOI|nr:P-loop containing nucleoside triphosphate hydrolase [Trema orientale]